MREIKFRAFINGSMWNVNGLACSDDSEQMDLIDHSIGGYSEVHNYDLTDNCILMQYTGLKDGNDVEIYEGDILEDFLDNKRYKVVWDDYGSWVFIPIGAEGHGMDYYEFEDETSSFAVVIGNIYENPDLLKSGNE
ncbi:hypothetical protein BTO30_16225 [Domibacillus antri]|uniref:YopX protein domain-containing protein n=2 Tax=Domibacillus antri TaxID=1714264 RepID=A0A1Q8Q1K5_9BACI|nr:hypothetical protein BTO30_16225 [Domibacillus antri]